MKKCSSVLLLLCLAWFLSCSTLAYSEQKPISVYLNNQPITFDVAPVIENGRTLVPMRAIFEALNVNVDWDASTQTVIARTEYLLCLELQIGNNIATKYFRSPSDDFDYETSEGTYQIDQLQKITLDVAPKLVDNRTMVPLRFIAESLGEEVEWDNNNRNIYIGDCQKIKESFSKTIDPYSLAAKDFKNMTASDIVNLYGHNYTISGHYTLDSYHGTTIMNYPNLPYQFLYDSELDAEMGVIDPNASIYWIMVLPGGRVNDYWHGGMTKVEIMNALPDNNQIKNMEFDEFFDQDYGAYRSVLRFDVENYSVTFSWSDSITDMPCDETWVFLNGYQGA